MTQGWQLPLVDLTSAYLASLATFLVAEVVRRPMYLLVGR